MATKTIYVCSKCGATTDSDHLCGWLVDSRAYPKEGSKLGEMIIRCPKHITEYAVREAAHGTQGIRS